MLLFNFFHKSRLYYGLPAFIDQISAIKRVYRSILYNIKILFKLPIRTNSNTLIIYVFTKTPLPNINLKRRCSPSTYQLYIL